MLKIKNQYVIISLLMIACLLSLSMSIMAQEIINVTSFSKDAVQNGDMYNIEKIDGKVIVPLYGSDNDTYERSKVSTLIHWSMMRRIVSKFELKDKSSKFFRRIPVVNVSKINV